MQEQTKNIEIQEQTKNIERDQVEKQNLFDPFIFARKR